MLLLSRHLSHLVFSPFAPLPIVGHWFEIRTPADLDN